MLTLARPVIAMHFVVTLVGRWRHGSQHRLLFIAKPTIIIIILLFPINGNCSIEQGSHRFVECPVVIIAHI